jgi:hypothetical protein
MQPQGASLPDAATLTVTVVAPNNPTSKSFTWPKSKRVGEAAAEAASALGFSGGNPTFMNSAGEVLDRDRPLVAAGVRDGDELELVDIGGGV